MKEVVIARIDAQVPSNLRLAIGGHGQINKDEMIQHIKDGDEIGIILIRRHMLFLKALASGEFTKAMVSVEDE